MMWLVHHATRFIQHTTMCVIEKHSLKYVSAVTKSNAQIVKKYLTILSRKGKWFVLIAITLTVQQVLSY